jgi:hypothetical protein
MCAPGVRRAARLAPLLLALRTAGHGKTAATVVRPLTVAISCNLSDGVNLGVDSAVTAPSPDGGVMKVYENAQKLFQVGERPIGVATYGLGVLPVERPQRASSQRRSQSVGRPSNVVLHAVGCERGNQWDR